MRDNEVLTRECDLPAETLRAALKQALTTVDGATLGETDDAAHKATFETGVTWTIGGRICSLPLNRSARGGRRSPSRGKSGTPSCRRTSARSCTKRALSAT